MNPGDLSALHCFLPNVHCLLEAPTRSYTLSLPTLQVLAGQEPSLVLVAFIYFFGKLLLVCHFCVFKRQRPKQTEEIFHPLIFSAKVPQS